MRLGWNPLQGATGYILRWREESGETIYNSFLLHSYMPALQSYQFNCSYFSDVGPGLSVTLPASSSYYQVTGLRLGRRYRFTVQPTFASGLGTESSVDEHTGNPPTHALSYTYCTYKHLFDTLFTTTNFFVQQYVWTGVWMWCFWCRHLQIGLALQDLCVNSSQVQRGRSALSEPGTHRYRSTEKKKSKHGIEK